MPGFVVFDGQRTFKVLEKSTDESLVSQYELKFQLVDSQNRVKEYTIVLKVEVPIEENQKEVDTVYFIPIKEEDEKTEEVSL